MLQPDPAMRPASMADIERWALDSGEAQNVRTLDQRNTTKGSKPSEQNRRWGGRSVFAIVCILILIAAGAAAYYEFVWDTPVISASRPAAPPELNPSAIRPAASPVQPSRIPSTATAMPQSGTSEDKKDSTDSVRRFIDQYNGGECFFVTPVAISSRAAVLEGLGSSTAPFDLLDKKFSQSLGFEASIGVRQVTQAQCPAITFLNAVRAEHARAPRTTLSSVELKNGDTLSGMIENINNRAIELLLISDSGEVRNLSNLLKPGTDAVSFTLTMRRPDGPGSDIAPQLLMALASARPMDSLRQTGTTTSSQLFVQALSESQGANMSISASIRYIQLKK
jgi:serine/threonine-protein kinase